MASVYHLGDVIIDENEPFIMLSHSFFKSGLAARAGGSATLLYLALKTFANHKTQQCFPNYDTLRELTGFKSNTTVKDALEKLSQIGLIEITRSPRQTNLYTIVRLSVVMAKNENPSDENRNLTITDSVIDSLQNLSGNNKNLTRRIELEETPIPPQGDSGDLANIEFTDLSHLPEAEPEEPTEEPQSDGEDDDEYSPSFVRFWLAYPNKKAKDGAWKIWKRRKFSPETVDAIVDAVNAQKKSADWTKDGGKYIPHPTTYLNQGRWKDGENEVAEAVSNDPYAVGPDGKYLARVPWGKRVNGRVPIDRKWNKEQRREWDDMYSNGF